MRLSDLIKDGPEGPKKDPEKKKSAAPPPAKEETFRLSELGNLQELQETAATIPDLPAAIPAEEEEEAASPFADEEPVGQRRRDRCGSEQAAPMLDLPGAPQVRHAPEDEEAAPSPFDDAAAPTRDLRHESRRAPEAAAGEPEKKRPRRSVLAGPESIGGEGAGVESSIIDPLLNNPHTPLRERALKFIIGFLQAIAEDEKPPLDEAEDIIYDFIEEPDAMENLCNLAVSVFDESNSMAIHLFNHTVYSMKLGIGLKWSQDRLVRLGVASLIHDVGMCAISQGIRHKEGKLTPEEIAEIRSHPQYGMEIVMHMYGDQFSWLAEAVYHEHERKNGRGYPQGLSGSQISEYGKIIGLADVYEALTHHRPQRKRLLPHKAVQEIVQTQKVQFHQRLLKVMIEELSAFSLNSLVRLNSNAIGRVTETIPGQPLRCRRPAYFRRRRQRNRGRPLYIAEGIPSPLYRR